MTTVQVPVGVDAVDEARRHVVLAEHLDHPLRRAVALVDEHDPVPRPASRVCPTIAALDVAAVLAPATGTAALHRGDRDVHVARTISPIASRRTAGRRPGVQVVVGDAERETLHQASPSAR